MTLDSQSSSPGDGSSVFAHVVPTSKVNAQLLMEILIRGNDGVKPMRNIELIAETAGVTVAAVKKRFGELGIEPIVNGGESAVSLLLEKEKSTPASKTKKNNEDVPPLTHWDTLAPGQKAVVGAFFGYDGTVFDGIPRKDMNTIARERGTTYPAAYGLLQGALKKLRSVEKPTRKKRESKLSETCVVKQKRVLIQSSIRPTHASIPEEQTRTYEDLLAWLRMPENDSLVTSFEETVRLAKSKHSTYSSAQLAPKIIEKFREGFLGHAIFSLAYYLKPEALVQDFIASIRPKEVSQPKKSTPPAPVAQSTSIQSPAKKPAPAPSRSTQPAVAKPALQASPIQVSHGPICPTFGFKSDALDWLRRQDIYGDLIRRAAEEKDDKNISALLVREEYLLLRILLKMKSDLDLQSISDIVHHVFPREHEEISSPKIPPILAVTSSEPVPSESPEELYLRKLIEIQENEAWMNILRPIVEAHKARKFDEVIKMYNAFSSDEDNADSMDVWDALIDLKELKLGMGGDGMRLFDLIFEVCECEFKKGDKSPGDEARAELLNIYSKDDLSWKNRMVILIEEAGCSEKEFRRLIELDSSTQIFDALKLFKLRVPLGEKTWKLWQEKMAEETDLARFFEELVLLDHTGEKRKGGDQPIDLHELRKKMRHIKFPKPGVE